MFFTFSFIFVFNFLLVKALFNKKTFWKYVINVRKCLPDQSIVLEQLQLAQEMGKNNLARARIFLRLALNEHILSQCINALERDKSYTVQCYEDFALLRNEEHYSAFLLLIQLLNTTQFTLWIKDKKYRRTKLL